MARWIVRLTAVGVQLVVAGAVLAILGVLPSDAPATGSSEDRARALAGKVRELAGRTVRDGRRMLLRPGGDARGRLRDAAGRAQRIEWAARQLPDAQGARSEVRRAALGVAEAAAVLARLSGPDDAARVRRARRALRHAEQRLREAAAELGTRARPVPDLVVAGPPR